MGEGKRKREMEGEGGGEGGCKYMSTWGGKERRKGGKEKEEVCNWVLPLFVQDDLFSDEGLFVPEMHDLFCQKSKKHTQ